MALVNIRVSKTPCAYYNNSLKNDCWIASRQTYCPMRADVSLTLLWYPRMWCINFFQRLRHNRFTTDVEIASTYSS
ncbi:hypothetical protein TNCT_255571 [Trichonephila clavata]|uniref:Uncharacterized protein n=1 Tax=Trichonephila clavata TaxID=2740835 RepID=A0A8X6FEX4_TRICU|nr:hypothetical protein TNCT_255571 [Trichonephila clavata]